MLNRVMWLIAGLLALSLIVAGCGTVTPGGEAPTSTLTRSALPSPTRDVASLAQSVLPSPTPVSIALSPIATPTAVPTRAQAPAIELVVLHTNDNWGETEPCG